MGYGLLQHEPTVLPEKGQVRHIFRCGTSRISQCGSGRLEHRIIAIDPGRATLELVSRKPGGHAYAFAHRDYASIDAARFDSMFAPVAQRRRHFNAECQPPVPQTGLLEIGSIAVGESPADGFAIDKYFDFDGIRRFRIQRPAMAPAVVHGIDRSLQHLCLHSILIHELALTRRWTCEMMDATRATSARWFTPPQPPARASSSGWTDCGPGGCMAAPRCNESLRPTRLK